MAPELIVFDFDGVIADSEGIACSVLADYAVAIGIPMTRDEALERFTGRRLADVAAAIESLAGRPLPGFGDELLCRTMAAFEQDLREMPGFSAFLARHIGQRRCIASSSARARIAFCLRLLGLEGAFGGTVFTADDVARGKPFPDIFLHAAAAMQVAPEACLVIEDGAGGVRAAVAAGMAVIGLTAASHLKPGHDRLLREAGAAHVARSYEEIDGLIAAM